MKDPKNQLNLNKTLIIAKVRPNDNEIKNLIREGFEEPQNYLKVNSNLIIGNNII